MQRRLVAAATAATVLLTPAAARGAVHTVASGETLSGIAAANGMPTAALAAANGLSPDALIEAGRTLRIPGLETLTLTRASADTTGATHQVQPGETLSGIAAANGISLALLAASNGLSTGSHAVAGTRLRIPSRPNASSNIGATSNTGEHLVQPGETLTGVAAANGVSLSALAAANGLRTTSWLIAGTRLHIPRRSDDNLSHGASPVGASGGQIACWNCAPTQSTVSIGALTLIVSAQSENGRTQIWRTSLSR
jgi:LysM repeat protein